MPTDILHRWSEGEPGRYESRRALPHGYRLRLTKGKKSRHWQGGPPRHQGAKCVLCRMSLHIVWDIDLTDPIIPMQFSGAFAPATRLPLYFCCHCPSPTLYRVASNDKIKVFRPADVTMDEENPFDDVPAEFERRSIEFEQIPDVVDALMSWTDDIGFDSLDSRSGRILSKYIGTKVSSDWDLPISQFGGMPLFFQSHQEEVCPNPRCAATELEHPYSFSDRWLLMKELALVHEEDAKLREESQHTQIAFHICWLCQTVHAQYRCD
jgi:hypothetical protein